MIHTSPIIYDTYIIYNLSIPTQSPTGWAVPVRQRGRAPRGLRYGCRPAHSAEDPHRGRTPPRLETERVITIFRVNTSKYKCKYTHVCTYPDVCIVCVYRSVYIQMCVYSCEYIQVCVCVVCISRCVYSVCVSPDVGG